MLKIVLIIGALFILFVAIDVTVGTLKFYFNRKCPKCGKRMKHQHNVYDEKGDLKESLFYCPHCNNIEIVSVLQMAKERD